jgi:hypothetical protein
MNPIKLWMKRKLLVTLLLVLLLTVGSAFCSVGVSAALASRQQTEAAAQNYTTVAIPYDPEWLGRTPVKSTDYGFEYHDLNALLAEAPVDARPCPAVPLQGVIPGSLPVKASDFDTDFRGYYMPEWPYEACVLAVHCDEITDQSYEQEVYSYSSGKETLCYTQTMKSYSYKFTVEEALSVPEPSGKELPVNTTLDEVYSDVCREDGSPVFEEGKTYLLWGRLHVWSQNYASFYPEDYVLPGFFSFLCEYETQYENGVISADQKEIWAVKTGDIPMAVEYTGSVQEFLQSEEGKPWQELIAAADRNHHSVKVLATDSVESLAPFCVRQDQLLEGRYYTPEEAQAGAKVCLVSAKWAEKNGVKVGDTVPISIYAPKYDVSQFVAPSDQPGLHPPKTDEAYMDWFPSYSEDDTGSGGDYEIIGVYSCPPPEYGSLRFDPDTVIIPKSTVEHAEQYITEEMTHYPLLNPWLLPNGTQEELEDWLTERGLGENFLYFDYGYSIAADAIGQMAENGTRLLIAGLAAFVLALVLFCMLLQLLTARTIRSMRLLGQNPASVRRCFVRTIPFWVVSAVVLGGLLSWAGFGWIREWLLSNAIRFDFRIATLAALGEAVVICAVLWLTALRASKTPLMQNGKHPKKRPVAAAEPSGHDAKRFPEDAAIRANTSETQPMLASMVVEASGHYESKKTNAVSWKGLITIALKNLRHRIPLALGLVLLTALLFSGGSLLRFLQRSQEEAVEAMTARTPITCVVTNASGTKTEGIGVFSAPFAQMLQGLRRERGCTIDDYVTDLRLSARERLDAPEEAELIRANCPEVLAPELKLEFDEGWDGSCLAGTEPVCCVSEALLPLANENGEIALNRGLDRPAVSLRIVGRVYGGEKLVVCPFDAQLVPGSSEAFLLDRCSFTISDARLLDEAKVAFAEYFIEPGIWNADDPLTAGLLIQDGEFSAAAAELEAHVGLLGRLRTVLLILSGCLSLLIGFLMNRRRLRELAVMRCLGLKRGKVLLAVALEQLLPMIPGIGIGLCVSLILLPDGSGIRDGALQMLLWLAGCLVCAALLTQVKPIRLMKTEE